VGDASGWWNLYKINAQDLQQPESKVGICGSKCLNLNQITSSVCISALGVAEEHLGCFCGRYSAAIQHAEC
jgi:hypothetical protein